MMALCLDRWSVRASHVRQQVRQDMASSDASGTTRSLCGVVTRPRSYLSRCRRTIEGAEKLGIASRSPTRPQWLGSPEAWAAATSATRDGELGTWDQPNAGEPLSSHGLHHACCFWCRTGLHWLASGVIYVEDLRLAAGYRPSVKHPGFGGGGTVWNAHMPDRPSPGKATPTMASCGPSLPHPLRSLPQAANGLHPQQPRHDAESSARHTPASHKNQASAAQRLAAGHSFSILQYAPPSCVMNDAIGLVSDHVSTELPGWPN